ncbi:hypothetical protein MTO96_050641 [Rhipicephalus appendiculatus]
MHEQDARTPGSVHEYTFAPRRSTHADDPVPFLVQNKPWWEQYSWAVHNTVSLMMTNSYGLAQKTGLLVEEWIQVIGMFCGALWQALLLGYGANLLAHKDYTKNNGHSEDALRIMSMTVARRSDESTLLRETVKMTPLVVKRRRI